MGKSYRLPAKEDDQNGEAGLDGIVALDPAGPIFSDNSDYAPDAPLGSRLGYRDAKVI